MNGLMLPYQQTAPKLNADYTAFEVVCTDSPPGCAIAGIAAGPGTPHSAAVYGQAGGAYPIPAAQEFSLQAAVSGQTNLQSYSGVCGASQYGPGVYAISESGNAIEATSTSQAYDTILAQSSSMQHAAVSAQNNNSGFGVWANSSGGKPSSPATAAGYFFSDNGNALQATSTNQGTDAVVAFTSSAGHAALAGHNTAPSSPGNVPSGFGIWATSNNTAIYGQGQPAGWFEGNVQVNGTLTVSGVNLLSSLQELQGDVGQLQSAQADSDGEAAGTQAQVIQLVGQVSQLASQVSQLQSQVSQLNQLASQVNQIGPLQSAVSQLQSEVSILLSRPV
jgi:hypothetical protein